MQKITFVFGYLFEHFDNLNFLQKYSSEALQFFKVTPVKKKSQEAEETWVFMENS